MITTPDEEPDWATKSGVDTNSDARLSRLPTYRGAPSRKRVPVDDQRAAMKEVKEMMRT